MHNDNGYAYAYLERGSENSFKRMRNFSLRSNSFLWRLAREYAISRDSKKVRVSFFAIAQFPGRKRKQLLDVVRLSSQSKDHA